METISIKNIQETLIADFESSFGDIVFRDIGVLINIVEIKLNEILLEILTTYPSVYIKNAKSISHPPNSINISNDVYSINIAPEINDSQKLVLAIIQRNIPASKKNSEQKLVVSLVTEHLKK